MLKDNTSLDGQGDCLNVDHGRSVEFQSFSGLDRLGWREEGRSNAIALPLP
ncbi:MAG: hypothetical protein LBU43_12235 [Candidatus Accumulibacter sp.]|nr:hypothetical protein [Accumulibacter sp.]